MDFILPKYAERIMSDYRYESASNLLDIILKKDELPFSLLKEVFPHFGEIGIDNIRKSIETSIYPLITGVDSDVSIKKPDFSVPQDIIKSRLSLQNNDSFMRMQRNILQVESPKRSDMEALYGPYSGTVLKSIKRFLKYPQPMRHCKIVYEAHNNRVGSTISELNKFDLHRFHRAAGGHDHDFIEDLLKDIKNYSRFVEEEVNPETKDVVLMLTNHYDLILNSARTEFVKRNVDPNIKILIKQIRKYNHIEGIREYTSNILNFLENLNPSNTEGDLIDFTKKHFYETGYITNLVEKAAQSNMLYVIEDKFVDLLDNDNGSKKLVPQKQINNLRKQFIAVQKAKRLNNGYIPFVSKVKELETNVIMKARLLILDDILEPDMTMDYVFSAAAQLIPQLKHILYEIN